MAFGGTNVPMGEKNVIEGVSVNGKKVEPVNKVADIPIPKAPEYGEATETSSGLMSKEDKAKLNKIPGNANSVTKTSQLENDSKFITRAEIPTSLPANGGNSSTVNGHTVKSDVPTNAKFTDTTYDPVTETKDGLMSKEDKEKLNGIPPGGLLAYTGNLSIGATGGSFKIETSAQPKLLMLYKTEIIATSHFGTDIISYVTDGKYYIASDKYANIHFENDGITISWAVGTDGRSFSYVVLC